MFLHPAWVTESPAQLRIIMPVTSIFSDAYKIFTLLDAGILDRSSVIIGDRYQYNYINENEFIIDEEKLIPDHLFKLDFFDAITS